MKHLLFVTIILYLSNKVSSLIDGDPDPIYFNPFLPNPVPQLQLGQVLQTITDQNCSSFSIESGLCPDQWQPVCDEEEFVTYPNCCEARRENVTEVVVGQCGEGAPLFGASDSPLGVTDCVDDDTMLLDRKNRKLLQEPVNVTKELAGQLAEAGIFPFIEVTFEKILGADDRVMIQIPEEFPFSAVGILESGCTGFLIGPRHVLTAAHCIYVLGTWILQQSFTPGQSNTTVPFGKIGWYSQRVPPEWYRDQSNVEFDYGLIFLNRDIGNVTGYLEYGIECERDFLPLSLVGYPTDKQPENTMWLASCGGVEYDCNMEIFDHECDTFAGMSGGPMFLYQLNELDEATFKVRGIHFGSAAETLNQGLTITQRMMDDIAGWMERDQGPPPGVN
eukprot:TRINITY_DN1176_c0_g1_i15.p1 TRINITY_DN1176_c0_g1~~TRINITY_DN1176_c0_g1_i15.p1  ORF type:complete len:423 (+),score=54.96 TRINITY_DN1176_c0_g1_i15:101-1270(+)